jgi:ATP synthase mitochondrial F1 complex assembly factor 2
MATHVSSALQVHLLHVIRASSWNSRLLRSTSLRCFHVSTAAASSSSKKSVVSKDTRLAGRSRFYKQVGVTSVAPPWESPDDKNKPDNNSQESPISAGVDGSQSASGVHHLPSAGKSSDLLKLMLSPRRPGTMEGPEVGNWFGVTLDGRILKTPMGQTLSLPSQHLAYAIAAEWDAQKKVLKPSQMPLMTLACTSLDQAATHPDAYRKEALRYLPNDTVSLLARCTRVLAYSRVTLCWGFQLFLCDSYCSHPMP